MHGAVGALMLELLLKAKSTVSHVWGRCFLLSAQH